MKMPQIEFWDQDWKALPAFYVVVLNPNVLKLF